MSLIQKTPTQASTYSMSNTPVTPLAGRRILLGVCGGIAAYRACDLARELMRAGAMVQCVLTSRATHFVTPLTFQGLTGQQALVDEFPSVPGQQDMNDVYAHLNLTRDIDCFVIAPLSANSLAAFAGGRAGSLLECCYLSNTAPVVLAPAMNTRMWQHPAVQSNLALLVERGCRIVDPESGTLACGDEGPGRLASIDAILATVVSACSAEAKATQTSDKVSIQRRAAVTENHALHEFSRESPSPARLPLHGKRFIVTAGGTREYIDPVRFITNASTGTLALAIAEGLLDAGAAVELIASEVDVPRDLAHRLVAHSGVRTAFDIQQAISEALPKADCLVMFAAIADYSPARYSPIKRKKDGKDWTLELTETQDILKSLAGLRQPDQLIVAVSLEDEDWLARSMKKAADKHVDLMLAVELGADLPFGDRKLHCALLADGVQVLPPARRDKTEVAIAITTWLAEHYALDSANKKELA
jgi:phosphopantothenoylcysteine decarboxylase/phosphopantothenate--cysteine ligase